MPESLPVSEDDAVVVRMHTERQIPSDQVLALYRAAEWWPERTARELDLVLRDSPAAGAWHGTQLIGFARAVTDGVLRAYVEDVVVAPSRRGSGIGQALLDRLIQALDAIPVVTLFCAPDLVRYYEASFFAATRQVVMHRTQRPPATRSTAPVT
jgi:GNAT superfamily N-acetyltransferase